MKKCVRGVFLWFILMGTPCFYRGRVWSTSLPAWQWRLVRNAWMGYATKLHGHVHIVLHLNQFCTLRQTGYL